MSDTLAAMKQVLAAYVSGEREPAPFIEEFARLEHRAEAEGDAEAVDLMWDVELILAEWEAGQWTGDEARRKLLDLARAPERASSAS
jgi:hypothetical protein